VAHRIESTVPDVYGGLPSSRGCAGTRFLSIGRNRIGVTLGAFCRYHRSMPAARRFPPPWTIEEHTESFIVKDATGQARGYFYFEEEFGRRSADVCFKATAVIGCVSSETGTRKKNLRHFGVR
jgi:hypothetical protein